MPVAKTYAHMEIQGEPFEENKRMYVNVITPKGLKKVRWYTEVEYRRMYPESEVKKNDVMDFNARHAFGFRNPGYIYIYKGNQEVIETFVDEHRNLFWRNLTFGYYTPSHLNLPELPSNISPIKLLWTDVMDHDDRMKPHDIVAKIVAEKLGTCITSDSEYQGEINGWIEKTLTVKENKMREDHFGEKHSHYMCDSEGNFYFWETSTKNFAVNMVVHLKMKVKEHKEINGNKYTVVWYCKEC